MTDKELESICLKEISPEKLWKNTSTLAQWERHSGTPDEYKAVEYLRETLSAYGLAVTVHQFESLLGYPGPASLRSVAPEQATMKCITHGFGGSTRGKPVEAEVSYVGGGAPADLAGKELKGRIALMEGLAIGRKVQNAQAAGAVGTIFILDNKLRDVCLSPVWGTPTPAQARTLPTIPAISILGSDGERLKAFLAKGMARVQLTAEPTLEWRMTPLLVGEVRGSKEPDQYLMFSGHHCSWYYGAMDNASSNATMMEVGRIMARHKGQIRRSMRLCFWPGHTQGRFSGSTWYNDNFWDDLYQHCVLHLNIDSVGAKGANIYHGAAMSETADFIAGIVQEVTGHRPHVDRAMRGGDQSFWGIGMPAMHIMAMVPAELATTAAAGFIQTGEGGLPWWWHTPEDTLDKIDLDLLAQDTRIHLLASLRACNNPVLPFDYERAADELLSELGKLRAAAGAAFDLAPVAAKAQDLKSRTRELGQAIGRLPKASEKDGRIGEVNRCLMTLGRHLNPVAYTINGPFDQDPAGLMPPLPGLQGSSRLASLPPNSDERRFLATELLRQRNRLEHAFTLALETLDGTLARLH